MHTNNIYHSLPHTHVYDIYISQAMKAYDPNNTGIYRGIKIGENIIENEYESVAKGEKVAFKKRKGSSAARIRVKGDLDEE